MNKTRFSKLLFAVSATAFFLVGCQNGPVKEAVSHKDDYKEAYIYGFPMIAGYKAMYEMAIDKTNSQFKAPFNQVWNDTATLETPATAPVNLPRIFP